MKSARHTHAAGAPAPGDMNEDKLRVMVRAQLDQMKREGFEEEDRLLRTLAERLLNRKTGRSGHSCRFVS